MFRTLSYTTYSPLFNKPDRELTKKEAKANFEYVISIKDERIKQLQNLLIPEGIILDYSRESLSKIQDWLFTFIKPDPDKNLDEIGRIIPDNTSCSVIFDISLYMGEVIKRKLVFPMWGYSKRRNQFYHQIGISSNSYHRDYFVSYELSLMNQATITIHNGNNQHTNTSILTDMYDYELSRSGEIKPPTKGDQNS